MQVKINKTMRYAQEKPGLPQVQTVEGQTLTVGKEISGYVARCIIDSGRGELVTEIAEPVKTEESQEPKQRRKRSKNKKKD